MLKRQKQLNLNKMQLKAKAKIKKIKPKYENYSTLFHSRSEVEGLYQALSEFATVNGLVISVIEKGKPVVISKSQVLDKKKQRRRKRRRRKSNLKSKSKKASPIIKYL